MITQGCQAPLSAHNVTNLCCPTTFAHNAAATGERPSSKKKKRRMINWFKPGKLDCKKDVWPDLVGVEGGIVSSYEDLGAGKPLGNGGRMHGG